MKKKYFFRAYYRLTLKRGTANPNTKIMRKVYFIEKTIYTEDGNQCYHEIVIALSSEKALKKAMERYHEINKLIWKVTKKDIINGCEYWKVDTEGYKFKMKMVPNEMYVCNENDF